MKVQEERWKRRGGIRVADAILPGRHWVGMAVALLSNVEYFSAKIHSSKSRIQRKRRRPLCSEQDCTLLLAVLEAS